VATARRELDRPAFSALRSGGWRDLITLLHPPYTAWHLSYVALGAAAAPTLHADRLGAALGAFALAVGVGAHAFDELNGRPLKTALSRRALIGLGVGGLLGALAIGIAGVFIVSPLLIPLVLVGAVLVPAYNLELAGGRLHNDVWFALAWGAFPAFTGYFSNALTIRTEGLLVAAACFLLSVAQRRLSTPVRELASMPTSGMPRMLLMFAPVLLPGDGLGSTQRPQGTDSNGRAPDLRPLLPRALEHYVRLKDHPDHCVSSGHT